MMESMRPRHLLHAFSTFQLGGPQARFVELANALGPAFRHTVVAMDNRFDAGERLIPTVDWTPLPLQVVKGGALANRGLFRQVLLRQRPDVLLSYNWGAIEWAAANAPRVCAQVHVEDGFGPEEVDRQLPRRVWMRRALLGWGRVPVVVASRMLEDIARRVWRLPSARVRYVPNGVATPAISGRSSRSQSSDPVCIGTVAGLRKEKNVARLLRAFARIHMSVPARLVIVGDGPLMAELQALARNLDVAERVTFTGYHSDPSVPMSRFDLFALSSDTEQLPIAMLEAMAMGIPVVATRVGDVPSILHRVSPATLSAPTDDDFARVLDNALNRQHAWPAWGQSGRELVQAEFSFQQMLDDWSGIWNGSKQSSV